jgi:hypothetical protein
MCQRGELNKFERVFYWSFLGLGCSIFRGASCSYFWAKTNLPATNATHAPMSRALCVALDRLGSPWIALERPGALLFLSELLAYLWFVPSHREQGGNKPCGSSF